MVRGYYTGASGMTAQMNRMDAVSNNLANVNTTGYKRDTAVQKAFPQLLMRRFHDNTEVQLPLGSVDRAPVVGKLGTGVETNEVYTVFEQGSFEQTENPFDLALGGDGFFVVDTPYGERLTRDGSFHLGPEGILVTRQGFPVLGENGPIHIKENNFVVDRQGRVFQNEAYAEDFDRLVSMRENEWEETGLVDELRIEQVRQPRYLRKQGANLLRTTEESGESLPIAQRPVVEQGFLETSNVNPVTEMVAMIEVNRAYEANQKVIESQDQATGRLLNEVLRLM
ncbi:flagellar hook-basal body protein [Spirochaeta africana]|uniref:Flagellar hook-basal body protein n=1 Tax=Spirochaeta africana (strain ATCC 700263 / DSM 8902 / Z-7692) TaxID=889378 RepID=H9UKB5_SPIAZ|nr:flagellar hook-basal body protein [Spirochaeta africana]AFG37958.1 flagellar hook-basal body protein [Spirochaeta africana DSM 8902]